jgi:hypothetical protein
MGESAIDHALEDVIKTSKRRTSAKGCDDKQQPRLLSYTFFLKHSSITEKFQKRH